jgi:hypothetical protein
VIIDRFQKHFMGELDLTPTQIRVGEILLRKVIPDLTHTDLSATFTRRYVVEVPAQSPIAPRTAPGYGSRILNVMLTLISIRATPTRGSTSRKSALSPRRLRSSS